MILTQLEIAHYAGVAKSFGYSQETVEEVVKVLEWGNENRADAKCTLLGHLAHAAEHFHNEMVSPGSIDSETGCTHIAHGVARLLLAMREGEKETRKLMKRRIEKEVEDGE